MFDPYHRWLAIPPEARPPTHYQLLGIAANETDPEVIKEAALRQTAHVRTYQTGPRAQECTQLLNEIAQARATLLDPAERQEYDAQLGQQQMSAREFPGPAVPEMPAVAAPPPVEVVMIEPAAEFAEREFAGLSLHRSGRFQRQAFWTSPSVLGYLLLLLLTGAATFWLTLRTLGPQDVAGQATPSPASNPSRTSAPGEPPR